MDLSLESKLGIGFILWTFTLACPWILPFLPLIAGIVGIAGILLEANSENEGMYLSEGT